jgi:hypothetical protein
VPAWGQDRRAVLTRLVLGSAFVAGLLISRKLYLSARLYPLTPVVDGLLPIPPPFDALVLAALLILVAIASVVPRPRPWIVAALGIALALALTDQSRWQPWFYQYVVMLAAFALAPRGDTGALDICRVVIPGIYVWSGVQKLNPVFASDIFPWLVKPVLDALPAGLQGATSHAWVLVPLVEIGIGLALVTRRFRDGAVITAVVMHAVILVLLGPLGHADNAVIWPWNIAMALFIVFLFWHDASPSGLRLLGPRAPAARAVAVLLFWVMPALSFIGMWDAYLSSALYSGNVAQGIVAITPALRSRLPPEISRHVIVNRVGTNVLTVWDWSMGELAAPPYPEQRVYLNVARRLCRYGEDTADVKLVIVDRPTLLTGQGRMRTYDCTGERAR